MKVTIYGASDDLIEVEGALDEEFTASDNDPNVLAFSDGTVVTVTYTDDGVWHIVKLHAGSATYERVAANGADADNYTDRVTLEGVFEWVTFGHSWNPIPARHARNEKSA